MLNKPFVSSLQRYHSCERWPLKGIGENKEQPLSDPAVAHEEPRVQ